MKVIDVPTPEELIQKPLSNRGYHEKGSIIRVKIN
jgi:hypothetical protein